MKKDRVVVAMSGGVDSSVVAALLQEEGHEVVGITLQLYDYGEALLKQSKTCCAAKDVEDAASVCNRLGILHYVLNYEDVFRDEVMEKFADSYLAGYTPVPCVTCNQTVKFRDLYRLAKNLSADFLATGHYVQKIQGQFGSEMHTGLDLKKDQSYFLFQTTKEQLDFISFPLGFKTKDETRQMAERFGLSVANKPDSQNICFVPDGNYAKVIERLRPGSALPGEIIDIETGKILGMHKGTINFTLGQRRGIGVATGESIYVVKIDAKENKVFVGPQHKLLHSSFKIEQTNWLLNDGENFPEDLTARVRSGPCNVSCKIDLDNNIVTLLEPSSLICPGQACVIYSKTRVIGGGFISEILD